MNRSVKIQQRKFARVANSIITLLLTMSLSLTSWMPGLAASQIDIVGPAGSGTFGMMVVLLANGNFVVTDPFYDLPNGTADVGAVYLYNGATATLISTLVGTSTNDQVGSGSVIPLTNGNFVVSSPLWDNGSATDAGAVTWVNGSSGLNGVVSVSNSLFGRKANDSIGSSSVVALSNGNYVVISPIWDNDTLIDAGAVTWGNGDSGISGAVSIGNSLIGKSGGAQVGSGGVTELHNGNYVVQSPKWPSALSPNYGAVTWGNGNTGISGAVNESNSLIGSKQDDNVGASPVILLSNGNYLVSSPDWDNGSAADAGAVTWGNGNSGVKGAINLNNSLLGSKSSDKIGDKGVEVLSNDNYVVSSPHWDNNSASDAGAVTWGNGATGTFGLVNGTNSLIGDSAFDQIGSFGVAALTNGNYVVISPRWDNGNIVNVGAVTWGNGTTGIKGVVDSSNSLVGSKNDDEVGQGLTPLPNGNYVVSSPFWDNGSVVDAGAATWRDGTISTSGFVDVSNSLVGTRKDDRVSRIGMLTGVGNSNYLVFSPDWHNSLNQEVGAVTWGSGATGISGEVSDNNSLVGSTIDDAIGIGSTTILNNGNYVVRSPNWDNDMILDAGAVTWGDGNTGIHGVVSRDNSLIGTLAGDMVGEVTALDDGNYVVRSPLWNNGNIRDAGAATWGNGSTGISGEIDSNNSLVGSTEFDRVGYGISLHFPAALNPGAYLVLSPFWSHDGIGAIGAATWGNAGSALRGTINSNNSLVGSKQGDAVGLFAIKFFNGYFMLANPGWANGNLNKAGAMTWINGSTGVIGLINSNNSVLGKVADGGAMMLALPDDLNKQLIVVRRAENIITLFRPTPAEISVTGKNLAISDGDNTPVSNDGTALGSRVVGSGALAQSFTISNTGDAALTVNTITLSGAQAGDFSISGATLPKVLAPNSAFTFTLNFTPGAAGQRSATVNITSNDNDENPYTFAVQGTGSQHRLTTNKTGSGTGSIALSPAGGNYNHNTIVTVTAKADAGSTFSGWSGDCSGTGACSVTMTSARSVTATFSKNGSGNAQTVYLPLITK